MVHRRIRVLLGVEDPHQHIHIGEHALYLLPVVMRYRVKVGQIQQDQPARSCTGLPTPNRRFELIPHARNGLYDFVGCCRICRRILCLGTNLAYRFVLFGIDPMFDLKPVQKLFASVPSPNRRLNF